MGYAVEFAPLVRQLLASAEDLTDDDRNAVLDGVTEELGRDADYFLARSPLGHESLHFRYDYAHPTWETLFVFDFIVDASNRAVGVVTVVYGECRTESMTDD